MIIWPWVWLHANTNSAMMSRSVCWLCYKVASPNSKGVVRHIAAVHAHHICCGVELERAATLSRMEDERLMPVMP